MKINEIWLERKKESKMNKFIYRDFDDLREISFLSYYTRGLTGAYIAGGCFKNIFEKQPVKDIDIFFESEQDYNDAIKKVMDWEHIVKTYENEKCVGFRDTQTGINFELIKSVFGIMEDVIEQFDFTIAKFGYMKTFAYEDDEGFAVYDHDIVHHKDFFQHLAQKRLVIDNKSDELTYPFSTFDRMFKYAKYGYQPCRETKIKIINSIRFAEDFTDDDVSRSMYDGGFD